MIFLALSCLQGRTMKNAAEELLELEPDGLQLTPGCVPTPGFLADLESRGIYTQTHHGFCETALRRPVWDGTTLLVDADSVHPPLYREADEEMSTHHLRNMEWWKRARDEVWGSALEVMYDNYILGCGGDVRLAMQMYLPLAVDVSHVEIQLQKGQMSEDTWRLLQKYPLISEIHVSESKGGKDVHAPITKRTPGLDWAREKMNSGTVVVLEAYMHKLNKDQRREQLAILRGES